MQRKKTKFEFVKPSIAQMVEKDPESIFRDLQIPNIKGLWSQQADILRDYYSDYQSKPDVAIELPTGTGKTLIGLLIAEYRRRSNRERVLYLCPTKQLARQVHSKAMEYGLPVSLLIGPQKNYPEKEYHNYASSRTVGITTYSAIFNTNPYRMDEANVLLLDDAHSAENYISSLWTVEIKRNENKEVFESIIDLFKEDISEFNYLRIMNGDIDYYKQLFDLIPYPSYIKKLPELIHLIEANIEDCGDEKYSWSKINENMEACQLFFSTKEINIKPIIPPTETHPSFSGPKQRIYMSATLGDGGNLERIAGKKKIYKIPIPKGWEKDSNGRRLILFPNMNFDENQALEVAIGAIRNQGRVLVLCPNNNAAQFFIKEIEKELPDYSIMESSEIEDSLDPFLSKEKAILVLTNRYDGIDLPGDACRLQILFGMPEATNLQEGFLWNRLSASAVLSELVKTRITQALGRCTRSSDDYANVIMLDPNLARFCSNQENLVGFHPEIQAEIKFGQDNSEKIESVDQMIDFMNDFTNDKEYFSDINDAITEIREHFEKQPKPEIQKLTTSVKYEIDFNYALWKKDIATALEKAKQILEMLSGGNDTKGYRIWWSYIAGNTAYLAKSMISVDETLDKNYYSSALKMSSGISWLAELVHSVPSGSNIPKLDPYLSTQIENIEHFLKNVGINGIKFEKHVKEILDLIKSDEAKKFEKGLDKLGKVLGFETIYASGDTVPDGVWYLRDNFYAFEAKTEEKEENPIYSDACRKAEGHKKWLREKKSLQDNVLINAIMISHKSTIREDAVPQARGLFHKKATDIRKIALKATTLLRRIRSTLNKDKEPNKLYRDLISEAIITEKLTYQDIENILLSEPLSNFERVK